MSFISLPGELHSRIGFFAATHTFLGRCSDLVALLCTSKALHRTLAFAANAHLYAAIFRAKFDAGRIDDRLGPRWSSAPCLAAELRKRFHALARIAASDVAGLHAREDAWTAYLMMLESDGKNEAQLLDGARGALWVKHAIAFRASLSSGDRAHWQADAGMAALLTWLLWYTSDKGARCTALS